MWIESTGRRWLSHEMLVHYFGPRPLEWSAARQQVVDHDCQGVLIRCRYRRPTPLFGRHVDGRATDVEARACRYCAEFGDSKIGQQQVRTVGSSAIATNKKVSRLDIAVNDAIVMSILKGICRLVDKLHHISRRKQSALLALLQPVGKRAFRAIG